MLRKLIILTEYANHIYESLFYVSGTLELYLPHRRKNLEGKMLEKIYLLLFKQPT